MFFVNGKLPPAILSLPFWFNNQTLIEDKKVFISITFARIIFKPCETTF